MVGKEIRQILVSRESQQVRGFRERGGYAGTGIVNRDFDQVSGVNVQYGDTAYLGEWREL